MYDARCLICDHTWLTYNSSDSCPVCGEYNDMFMAEHEHDSGCRYLGNDIWDCGTIDNNQLEIQ